MIESELISKLAVANATIALQVQQISLLESKVMPLTKHATVEVLFLNPHPQ